mgnify:CR=1 FL=1
MVLRAIYTRGQSSGADIAQALAVPFPVLNSVLTVMRRQTLIDIVSPTGRSEHHFDTTS